MLLILTVVAVFAVLVASEWLWRRRDVQSEFTRKFVHVTVGSFVAFWPYFLSPADIKLLSLAFLLVAALSKYLHIFQAIHSVQRTTWGEFWFALVVGILAFDLGHPHIYTAALLEMSLADGLAAMIGTRFGKRQRYMIFGSPKSVIGTLTFFVVSCLILAGYYLATPAVATPVLGIVLISLVAAVLENIAIRGFDNLAVPLFVAAALRFFS